MREEMIAVDSPHASNASEIAQVLSQSGLHPEYDERPLNAVRGRSFAKTTIYVPESECHRAREVLSTWYAESDRCIERVTSGIWGDLLFPSLISLALGVVGGVLTRQVGVGLIVAFLSFVLLVALWHKRNSSRGDME